MGSLTDDYPGLNPITIENIQIKEEYSYPLTKSASASVPSNSVIAPVVKPGMPVARFNSLGWATKRGGIDKPSCSAPASTQRTLKSARKVCCSDRALFKSIASVRDFTSGRVTAHT
jgi:hypothetical protein